MIEEVELKMPISNRSANWFNIYLNDGQIINTYEFLIVGQNKYSIRLQNLYTDKIYTILKKDITKIIGYIERKQYGENKKNGYLLRQDN